MDLRKRPGRFLDLVEFKGEAFVIERAGRAKAALVPLNEYQEIQRGKQAVKQRIWEMTQAMREHVATSGLSDTKVQRIIDEAIAEVRAENTT